jgi:galactonate dehydratase
MKRRNFLYGIGSASALLASNKLTGQNIFPEELDDCGCYPNASILSEQEKPRVNPTPWQRGDYDYVLSKVRITDLKTIPVSVTPTSDRPYVFVKLETNVGVVGWGEATLEGKAGSAMQAVHDLKDSIIGSDPIQVTHHWQSMWVHAFFRGGPILGSAISGIDHALWDLRGKLLGLPVYKLLGGPTDPEGVRGYYHARAGTRDELVELRNSAEKLGVTAFKTGLPSQTYEWIDTHAKIDRAIKQLQMIRESLGPKIDIACDFHAKTSPSVASIIIKEIEPLNLLFVEELCPPENAKAMAKIAKRSTTPIATGERLIAHFGFREIIEQGIVDIIQPDCAHTGGITGVWAAGALAAASGISVAPHNCTGPIGGLAAIHTDAAMPNFIVQEVCSGVNSSLNERVWEEWLGFQAQRMVNGKYPLSDKPGLGFEVNEEALKKYPFAGTVPMARVFADDGSVCGW